MAEHEFILKAGPTGLKGRDHSRKVSETGRSSFRTKRSMEEDKVPLTIDVLHAVEELFNKGPVQILPREVPLEDIKKQKKALSFFRNAADSSKKEVEEAVTLVRANLKKIPDLVKRAEFRTGEYKVALELQESKEAEKAAKASAAADKEVKVLEERLAEARARATEKREKASRLSRKRKVCSSLRPIRHTHTVFV